MVQRNVVTPEMNNAQLSEWLARNAAGVARERIINTMSVDELREWTARRHRRALEQ